MLTNADASPIPSGAYGIADHPTAIWSKGNNTNPEGPIDKLGFMTFVIGGFAAELGALYRLLAARAQGAQMAREFQGAYERLVKHLAETGALRVGKQVGRILECHLQDARGKSATAYRQTQRRVRCPMRAALRP